MLIKHIFRSICVQYTLCHIIYILEHSVNKKYIFKLPNLVTPLVVALHKLGNDICVSIQRDGDFDDVTH